MSIFYNYLRRGVVALAMLFAFYSISLYSQPPCSQEDFNPNNGPNIPYICNDQNGDLSITISGTDFPSLGCNNCTFTLKYCYRIIPQMNNPSPRFDVMFKDISYSPSECWYCIWKNNDLLVEILYKEIIKLYHPMFCTTWQANHLVMKSSCALYDGIQHAWQICGSQSGCCYKDYVIGLNCDEGDLEFLTFYTNGSDIYYDPAPPNNITCTTPCTIKCGVLQLRPDCEIPCDYGAWTSQTISNIPYHTNECPGCSLTIAFDYRTTVNCSPPWKDYRLTSVNGTSGCTNCTYYQEDWNNLWYFAMDYLLRHGPLQLPGLNQTLEEYRFVQSPCWSQFYNKYTECKSTQCCMSIWSVTNTNGNYTTNLVSRSPYLDNCPETGCRVICADYPSKTRSLYIDSVENQLSDYLDITIMPNNNSDLYDIKILSKLNGSIDITIFDLLGNIVSKNDGVKNSGEYLCNIYVKNMTSGIYFCLLKLDDKFIMKTFSLIR